MIRRVSGAGCARERVVELNNVTYSGPPIDDSEILARLPSNLAGLLNQINGFIQYGGGLHVRGACRGPEWHSLRNAWEGEAAYWNLYPEIKQDDVPFAKDCMGDQFLLRDHVVIKLSAETGELESLGIGLRELFASISADPVAFLSMQPLIQYGNDGGRLEPGQLLAAFPPFCFREASEGVKLVAISTVERRLFLADLASQIHSVPDGGTIQFKVQ